MSCGSCACVLGTFSAKILLLSCANFLQISCNSCTCVSGHFSAKILLLSCAIFLQISCGSFACVLGTFSAKIVILSCANFLQISCKYCTCVSRNFSPKISCKHYSNMACLHYFASAIEHSQLKFISPALYTNTGKTTQTSRTQGSRVKLSSVKEFLCSTFHHPDGWGTDPLRLCLI